MSPNNQKRAQAEMDSSDFDEEDSDLENDLEEQDTVWTIKYHKKPVRNSSKRVRKIWDEAQKHESSFHGKGQSKDALDLRYAVEPATWLGMQHYTKCTSE